MSVPPWFMALGIPDSCVSNNSSAHEKGRRFSISPQRGSASDEIWRVRVDGCWLQGDVKKVDYLFWGQSALGRKVILLVELKGQDFHKALQQVADTLHRLCKRAEGNIIHVGDHQASPGHDFPGNGGVRAYVVLSKGKGVPQRARYKEKIRERYGVIVYHCERKLEADGLDALLSMLSRQNPAV